MINNVTLIGRLTKDCDLQFTGGGSAVGNFTLAVNRDFTNQNGEREADFIQCVIWRKPAENFANQTRKGSLVGITGRIQTRSYENQQRQIVYVTEIVVETYQLLESRDQLDKRDQANQQHQQNGSHQTNQQPDPQEINHAADKIANSQQAPIDGMSQYGGNVNNQN